MLLDEWDTNSIEICNAFGHKIANSINKTCDGNRDLVELLVDICKNQINPLGSVSEYILEGMDEEISSGSSGGGGKTSETTTEQFINLLGTGAKAIGSLAGTFSYLEIGDTIVAEALGEEYVDKRHPVERVVKSMEPLTIVSRSVLTGGVPMSTINVERTIEETQNAMERVRDTDPPSSGEQESVAAEVTAGAVNGFIGSAIEVGKSISGVDATDTNLPEGSTPPTTAKPISTTSNPPTTGTPKSSGTGTKKKAGGSTGGGNSSGQSPSSTSAPITSAPSPSPVTQQTAPSTTRVTTSTIPRTAVPTTAPSTTKITPSSISTMPSTTITTIPSNTLPVSTSAPKTTLIEKFLTSPQTEPQHIGGEYSEQGYKGTERNTYTAAIKTTTSSTAFEKPELTVDEIIKGKKYNRVPISEKPIISGKPNIPTTVIPVSGGIGASAAAGLAAKAYMDSHRNQPEKKVQNTDYGPEVTNELDFDNWVEDPEYFGEEDHEVLEEVQKPIEYYDLDAEDLNLDEIEFDNNKYNIDEEDGFIDSKKYDFDFELEELV